MKLFRLNTLIISVTLIAMIGIMGVGYAQWKDDIKLFGKVSTGYASISLSHPNSYACRPLSMVVTEPGEVRSEFVITNTGTVPMKLESKSDNIDFACEELLSGVSATGYIVTEISNGQHGKYIEDLTGTVRMVTLNDSWSQDIDITTSIQVNIHEFVKEEDVVTPLPAEPINPADAITTTPLEETVSKITIPDQSEIIIEETTIDANEVIETTIDE